MAIVAPFRSPHPLLARIAQMAIWFALSDLTQGAIGFATSLVVARGMGREAFGQFVFWAAVASALTVALDLGVGVWLTREVARGDSRPGALLGAALSVRLTTFSVVATAIVLGTLGRISAESFSALAAVLVLAAAGLAYGCMSAVCRTRPEHVRAIVAIESGGAMAQLISISVIALLRGSFVALLRSAAVIEVLQLVIAVVWWRSRVSVGDWIRWSSWRESPEALRGAIPFAASGLFANAQTRVGPLMLGLWSTTGQVALFGAATRLGNVARVLPHAAFSAALPVFAGRAPVDLRVARGRFESFVLQFSAVAAVLTGAAAPVILAVTYGEAFATGSATLVWVAASLIPSLTNSARKLYLYATGGEAIAVRWSGISLGLQIVIAAVLIPWFGAAGAAAALLVAEVAIWWPLRRADVALQPCAAST